ncbi:MAG: ATP-binding cassette domain-containing protein [Thermodesulfobacteriota bacterium]
MIEVNHLTHIYNQGTPWEIKALERISFCIARGECFGIIGESGSGKSTLAQHLAGLLSPTLGSVLFDGADIYHPQGGREMRKKVGLIFQSPGDQLFEESVFKEISFSLRQRKNLSPVQIEERVKGVCRKLYPPLEDLMDRSPFELSQGERIMVVIASVLISKPEVLVFDEPYAGLDPDYRSNVLQQLEILHRNKQTLIILSNQSEGLIHLLDRIMFLHQGKIVAQGKLQDLLASRDIDHRITDLLPPLTRMLIHLRQKGIEVIPSLDPPSAIALEIHRLLEKKRKDQ